MHRHSFVLHTLIQTCVVGSSNYDYTITYYEVTKKVENGYKLVEIDKHTGAQKGWCTAADGYPLIGLSVVSPKHPLYKRWAQRRLQDRLEGLDRA